MARSRRARVFGTVLAVGAVLAATPAAASARHHPVVTVTVSANASGVGQSDAPVTVDDWRSGDFAGYSAADDKAFGTWRGRPITSATDFQADSSWSDFDKAKRIIEDWKGQNQGILLSISVPLFVGYGDHLKAAASGYFDQHFVAMARNLVAAGLGNSVLRIGWEFNGTWFKWGITNGRHADQYATRAREFASAWRHIVTAIRTVKGEHFSFDWCVAAGPHYPNLQLAYPGNSYVDYIGEDVYDWNRDGHASSPKSRWHAIVYQGTGLAWLSKFAAAHHEPISIPEWALVHDTLHKQHSGGDDTYFIQKMHDWFANHDVEYENYFNFSDGFEESYTMNSSSGQFPQAGKLYRSLWSRPGGIRHLS